MRLFNEPLSSRINMSNLWPFRDKEWFSWLEGNIVATKALAGVSKCRECLPIASQISQTSNSSGDGDRVSLFAILNKLLSMWMTIYGSGPAGGFSNMCRKTWVVSRTFCREINSVEAPSQEKVISLVIPTTNQICSSNLIGRRQIHSHSCHLLLSFGGPWAAATESR